MKLIKINTDHYIIVDDSEIKEGDWMYLQQGNTPSTKLGEIARCEFADANNLGVIWKKITHSTQPLGIGWQQEVIELSLQEVKELIGEVDVEKKGWEYTFKKFGGVDDFYDTEQGFIDGYNQAIEDNKEKKYKEEDIRKAWEAGMRFIGEDKGSFGEFIQSLQTKTEWEVEIVDGKLKLL